MKAKNAAGETIEVTDLSIDLDELKGLVMTIGGQSRRVSLSGARWRVPSAASPVLRV